MEGVERAPVVETPRGGASDDQPGSARSSMTDRASVQTSRQIVVPISRDAAERAGILVATVGTASGTATLRVPAVIEPNAYRSVAVTALVSGRVTRVAGDLGQRVRRGRDPGRDL